MSILKHRVRFMYADTTDGDARESLDATSVDYDTAHNPDALLELAYELADEHFIDPEGIRPVSATVVHVRRLVAPGITQTVSCAAASHPVHNFRNAQAIR